MVLKKKKGKVCPERTTLSQKDVQGRGLILEVMAGDGGSGFLQCM
jgi:hypothetical protein